MCVCVCVCARARALRPRFVPPQSQEELTLAFILEKKLFVVQPRRGHLEVRGRERGGWGGERMCEREIQNEKLFVVQPRRGLLKV